MVNLEERTCEKIGFLTYSLLGCYQCSQRGSPSVLRVGPGRTTNCSPSSPGENFARG